jgi:hypothetical protein
MTDKLKIFKKVILASGAIMRSIVGIGAAVLAILALKNKKK